MNKTFAFVAFLTFAVCVTAQSQRPQTVERVFSLPDRNVEPTASLQGIVVSETTGAPLAGATLKLSLHFENAMQALLWESAGKQLTTTIRTNDSGGFSAPGIVAGSYDLHVEMDGFVSATFDQRTETGRVPWLHLDAGERIDNVRIALQSPSRIEGRIRDKSGQPLSGVPVELFRSDELSTPVAIANSAVEGIYELTGLLAGRYVLVAGAPLALNGQPPRSFALQVALGPAEKMNQDFSLETTGRYTVRGAVSVRDSSVSSQALNVTIETKPPGAKSAIRLNSGLRYSPQTGAFEIPDLLPGVYRLNGRPVDSQKCSRGADIVVTSSDVAGVTLAVVPCR